jgi:hypothetical protein
MLELSESRSQDLLGVRLETHSPKYQPHVKYVLAGTNVQFRLSASIFGFAEYGYHLQS